MGSCVGSVCLTGLFKAIPHEVAGERLLYLEASNESLDYQGERVLSDALERSTDYFLRYGNIDLDHLTLLGPKQGIPDYHLYEIGRPIEVSIQHPRTFVKALITQGDGAGALRANEFWDSLTKQHPPARWYPSVGGQVINTESEIDPETGAKVGVVTDVRWCNIGLSKTPVNLTVPNAATIPFGVFAKCWGAGGFDLQKALAASYATDAAALSGGGAFGRQSLDRRIYTYWEFRDAAAKAVLKGKAKRDPDSLFAFAVRRGIPEDEAAEWAERLLHDLERNRKTRIAA